MTLTAVLKHFRFKTKCQMFPLLLVTEFVLTEGVLLEEVSVMKCRSVFLQHLCEQNRKPFPETCLSFVNRPLKQINTYRSTRMTLVEQTLILLHPISFVLNMTMVIFALLNRNSVFNMKSFLTAGGDKPPNRCRHKWFKFNF